MNVLVLGGSGGIGQEVVKNFCQTKGNWISWSYYSWRNQLQELEDYIINSGNSPQAIHFRIGGDIDNNWKNDLMSLVPLLGSASLSNDPKSWHRLDHVVNCVGALHDRTLAKMSDDELYENIYINLNANFELCRNVVPYMAEGGSITLISSIIGANGGFGQTNYSACKAGIEALTKSLAMELAGRKVRVNCIRPSIVDTPIFNKLTVDQKQSLSDRSLLKRMATPKEIADLIYFVATKGTYFDGDIIPCTGGFR